MTTTKIISAGEHATLTLQEGDALNIVPAAGGAGMAYLLDDAAGRGNSLQSWTLAATTLQQIGPYQGIRRVRITCSSGSIVATTLPAILNLPQIVVSSAAPNNNDGRPDGTLYVQTAP
ncbi:hypothetical protein [Herbaspirillum sp. YR522]|uniref:hypothetical protein n=1 Tax=Herbaspirillum sp. YR522 TaxID=1144342 RepID=UPI00026FB34E|nr:hypothetical protein [Herbaspirillum sp. YR522]EJN07795.1 hypothetical protein PMI40_01691 [Herbaspirillum sp. YR522]